MALVDTGSTHTFMDLKFSTKIQCTTVTNSMETVKVAGGGELQSGAHIPATPYTIQTHQFNNSFKILPLKGYDIVLGGDWLKQHSPIKFDYDTKQLKIRTPGGTKITLRMNH